MTYRAHVENGRDIAEDVGVKNKVEIVGDRFLDCGNGCGYLPTERV
jgi:hypothetical protein